MANLERRALKKYVRTYGALETPHDPATWPAVFWAWTATHDGRTYVVVGIDPVASTPGYEVLAVYQATTTGLGRRLKRWPKAIEDTPTVDQVQRWDRRYRKRLAWWE
jgi:hypothetical protein